MNAIVAISAAFLRGDVLTIKTAFKDFGITNLPRECGRSIERKFGVQLARVKKEGKSRYGCPCIWYEYRLPTTQYNEDGRKRMVEYVQSHIKNMPPPKTDKEVKRLKDLGINNRLF